MKNKADILTFCKKLRMERKANKKELLWKKNACLARIHTWLLMYFWFSNDLYLCRILIRNYLFETAVIKCKAMLSKLLSVLM